VLGSARPTGDELHEPLRIEIDDPERAESLRRALALFHADLVRLDGHAEVTVELIAGNPEPRVTDALHAIDQWLARTGTPSVRVHLDGQVYTLSAPR
jgi:hypothetical protein